MASPRKELPVVCAVITDDLGRILVGKRPQGKVLGGKWEFPGGKIDPGETPEYALRREIQEELEATITVLEPLSEVVNPYETVTIRLMPYRARVESGTLRLLEHDEIRWLDVSELRTVDLAEADVKVADELQALAAVSR